jgi:hypothetical protein
MKTARARNLMLLAAAVVLCFAGNAMATTLFDLSPTNGTTFRGSDFGPGQGVIVGTTTTITDMAFFLNMPNGGDLKFMIWDGTNANLLFSSVLSGVAASNTQTWVSANPFSFTLTAGNEYWFGIIADNNVDVGYIFPPITYSANGLTAVTTGNSNYNSFANPVFSGYASAEIGLRLFGGTTVPEPGSLLLLGSGVLGVVGVLRRKLSL